MRTALYLNNWINDVRKFQSKAFIIQYFQYFLFHKRFSKHVCRVYFFDIFRSIVSATFFTASNPFEAADSMGSIIFAVEAIFASTSFLFCSVL